MRPLAVAIFCCVTSCGHPKPDAPDKAAALAIPASPVASRARVDFATQVQPILEARCRPCHFPGGIMYERRPFDRPETIYALGEKLFTRIEDPGEQRTVREFLSQGQE